jgi:hypothetical protein
MNLGTVEDDDETMEHETGEGDEMQAGKGLGQALVVAGEATEAGQPGAAALHDPAPGPQDAATQPCLASGSLITSRRMPWAAASSAGSSPL